METNNNKPWTVSISPELGIVRKKWCGPFYDKTWLRNHIDVLEIVAPDYVVSFGKEDDGVYIDYHYIKGIALGQWSRDHYADNIDTVIEMWQRSTTFWVDDLKRTLPYAHWDWTSGNTIVCDDGSLQMIDWDQCCIASKQKIRECFVYRIECERAGIVELNPDFSVPFDKFKASVISYFDKKIS